MSRQFIIGGIIKMAQVIYNYPIAVIYKGTVKDLAKVNELLTLHGHPNTVYTIGGGEEFGTYIKFKDGTLDHGKVADINREDTNAVFKQVAELEFDGFDKDIKNAYGGTKEDYVKNYGHFATFGVCTEDGMFLDWDDVSFEPSYEEMWLDHKQDCMIAIVKAVVTTTGTTDDEIYKNINVKSETVEKAKEAKVV